MTEGPRCRNCGERIVLADDGSIWFHVIGDGWRMSCGLVAEPIVGASDV